MHVLQKNQGKLNCIVFTCFNWCSCTQSNTFFPGMALSQVETRSAQVHLYMKTKRSERVRPSEVKQRAIHPAKKVLKQTNNNSRNTGQTEVIGKWRQVTAAYVSISAGETPVLKQACQYGLHCSPELMTSVFVLFTDISMESSGSIIYMYHCINKARSYSFRCKKKWMTNGTFPSSMAINLIMPNKNDL